MIHYPTIPICIKLIFPFIRDRMAKREPVPQYEFEREGMKKLESTLELMKRSNYSPSLAKAAYLFCSVIDGHHFSNGNKRLAVALLTYFLLINGRDIHVPYIAELQRQMRRVFPRLEWEHIDAFSRAEEYFFYHLALVIADRNQKGNLSFSQEQKMVRTLLRYITR
ncbi:hypothetical protein AUJ46_00630 [Candidatus Peregrinibacteria bacterium CG1_02_54_53]|nr:MAG: hypothetical protein AUJ46_00630 [Candidatus Peregrinibacteria bacterium CG1_02_54_53]